MYMLTIYFRPYINVHICIYTHNYINACKLFVGIAKAVFRYISKTIKCWGNNHSISY